MDHTVAAGDSAEAEIGSRGEVIVLADDGFDAILLRADDALVLVRAGGAFGDLLRAVAEVPDAVLLPLRIDIDNGDLFRRHLRHGAARLHIEAQMAMLAASNVGVEKAGLFGIVKIR